MINTKAQPDRYNETVPDGKTVAFCRCWQSGKFPYCDGTHRTINAETGDSVGPVIVKGSAGGAAS
jgi:CDGSH-type Zn-finger protein